MRLLTSVLAPVLACVAGVGAADTVSVAPELWDRPRGGRTILDHVAVKSAVKAHLDRPGSRLVIHHARGLEAQLQAEELRAWLVALAVEPAGIELRGGLGDGEQLKIEIAASP